MSKIDWSKIERMKKRTWRDLLIKIFPFAIFKCPDCGKRQMDLNYKFNAGQCDECFDYERENWN